MQRVLTVSLLRSPAAGVVCSAVLLFPAAVWAQPYTINTIAGNGTAGYAGDSGSATTAQLNTPVGVEVDGTGNLYIGDGGNQRVRLVSNGTISTIAGNGTDGYGGDGAAAGSAQLSSPTHMVLDSSGNLYISDSGNNVIRMVSTAGTISTIAGSVCTSDQTTSCGAGYSGDGGNATAALLNNPLGLAIDSAGSVYIADSGNNVIRKISGGTISTLPVTVKLNHPDDVVIDSSGNLYIADTNNSRIIRVTSAGAVSNFAGTGVSGFGGDNGPAIRAQLSFPAALALDGSGSLYIADTLNSRIRRVAKDGTITTIAGNGQLSYSGDGGAATNAALYFPRAIAADASGNVYIADTDNNRVRVLESPAPVISNNGIVNAASFAPHISPGALASVFGNYFGSSNAGAGVPLPTTLNQVRINVNGRPAPILYVTPTQVNFQVPWDTALGTADVSVMLNGTNSNTATVPVLAAGPGIFTQNSGAAVVQNADYSLNTQANPAPAGATIIAYLTGSGPLSASVPDGTATPSTPLIRLTAPVTATIGTQPADVGFAGLAPGFVGLVQVNLSIPSGLATGSYPLTITIGTEASNAASISVKQ